MRRLILFRHGKAEMAGITGGDRERPLSQGGFADCVRTAQWLAAAGFAPDLVFVSPALRTRSTWESASPAFPGARAEVREALYLASDDVIADVLEGASAGIETVMVVGHNPGLQDLGARLAAESGASEPQIHRIGEGFPTAAAVVFRMVDAEAAGLEAAYEPPRSPGGPPRWAFVRAPSGGPA